MAFKVDENLPVEIADLLRQAGYDAVTVFEQHLEGSTDVVGGDDDSTTLFVETLCAGDDEVS